MNRDYLNHIDLLLSVVSKKIDDQQKFILWAISTFHENTEVLIKILKLCTKNNFKYEMYDGCPFLIAALRHHCDVNVIKKLYEVCTFSVDTKTYLKALLKMVRAYPPNVLEFALTSRCIERSMQYKLLVAVMNYRSSEEYIEVIVNKYGVIGQGEDISPAYIAVTRCNIHVIKILMENGYYDFDLHRYTKDIRIKEYLLTFQELP